MCYAKPGPRCSAHAEQTYKRTKAAYRDAKDNVSARRDFLVAQRDYFGTRKGQAYAAQRVQALLDQGKSTDAALLKLQISEARAHRQERMKMMKEVQEAASALPDAERSLEVGYPRPKAPFADYAKLSAQDVDNYVSPPSSSLPIPWIATTADKTLTRNGWTGFEQDKAIRAHVDRLCQVCGKKVIGPLVHLDIAASSSPHVPRTSGSGMHPRCAPVAMKFCPHFSRRSTNEDTPVAFSWDGPGQGYHCDDSEEDIADAYAGRRAPGVNLQLESDYVTARTGSRLITVGDLKDLARAQARNEEPSESTGTTVRLDPGKVGKGMPVDLSWFPSASTSEVPASGAVPDVGRVHQQRSLVGSRAS